MNSLNDEVCEYTLTPVTEDFKMHEVCEYTLTPVTEDFKMHCYWRNKIPDSTCAKGCRNKDGNCWVGW